MPSHPEPAPAPADDDAPTCNIWYIQRELGVRVYGTRRLLRYLRLLVAEQAFPPPLPTLVKKQLVTEPVADSRWRKAAVDAWLDDRLPPVTAAALAAKAARAAAAEMDEAARHLGRGRPRLTVVQ